MEKASPMGSPAFSERGKTPDQIFINSSDGLTVGCPVLHFAEYSVIGIDNSIVSFNSFSEGALNSSHRLGITWSIIFFKPEIFSGISVISAALPKIITLR